MAFGTYKIIVRYQAAKFALCNSNSVDDVNAISDFWQSFYDQSCLEYIYMNNLRFSKVLLKILPDDTDEQLVDISLLTDTQIRIASSEDILIPLGGIYL